MNEYKYQASPEYYSGTPKMIQWVIKYSGGLVKDEKQAAYVLFGFAALILTITIILLSNTFGFGGPPEPPAGFKGNIPNTPEYQNPPRPEDLR